MTFTITHQQFWNKVNGKHSTMFQETVKGQGHETFNIWYEGEEVNDTAGEHHFQATFALQSLAAIIPFTHLQKLSTYLRVLTTPRSPTNIVPRLIINKPAQYCPSLSCFLFACVQIWSVHNNNTDDRCHKNRTSFCSSFYQLPVSTTHSVIKISIRTMCPINAFCTQ